MPFGSANAPKVFQRIMNTILGFLPFLKVFLDDILIFSNNEDEHSNHITQVLNILKDNNLTIGFEKSTFFAKEVKYLGHIISENGIKPDIERIKDLKGFNSPRNKKQLQKLIGTINWFRPFINNLSNKLSPITKKLKISQEFTWSQKEQEIINEILNEIKKSTMLGIPDLNNPFYLDTDASETAIGATLYQENQLIGFFSKTLTESQRNYSNTERELLAIIEALKHFRTIIYGTKIIIRTDHSNLINNPELHTSRAQRWKLVLEEYNHELIYVPGSKNQIPDMLSRCGIIKEKIIQI